MSNIPNNDQLEDAKWGRRFCISVGADGLPQCKWAKERGGSKNPITKATLPNQVLNFLVDNCLPCTAFSHLDCFTHFENISTGERYRAHPMFMGEAWYDFAMVRLQSRKHPKLPARIHTFVDLTNLLPGRNVRTYANAQPAVGEGFYAVIESFEPVPHGFGDPNDDNGNDDANDAFANDLVGRFLRTETIIDGQHQPTLYLVHVDSIISPLVGIIDVPAQSTPVPPQDKHNCRHPIQKGNEREHYLFLLHHRATWAECWNGVIRNLHGYGDDEEETSEPEDTWSDND